MEPLAHSLNQFTELRRRLLEAEPDIDETTLFDTLEGITDLNEAIAEIVRSALVDAALVCGLKERMADLNARLGRLQGRCERKRELALEAMEAAGLSRIMQPDFTLTLKTNPPAVRVTDEQAIPEWFWIPQPARLDKRAILETLKAGTGVSGAELSNPRNSLSVRTR